MPCCSSQAPCVRRTTATLRYACCVYQLKLLLLHCSKALEVARGCALAAGFCVRGGFVSPSHELYVRPKLERAGSVYLPTFLRLALTRELTATSDWVNVGAWESHPSRAAWPDYPEVR